MKIIYASHPECTQDDLTEINRIAESDDPTWLCFGGIIEVNGHVYQVMPD